MTLSAPLSSAAITGVTGSTTWLGSPPAACGLGQLVGVTAFAWDEQQGINLVTSQQAQEAFDLNKEPAAMRVLQKRVGEKRAPGADVYTQSQAAIKFQVRDFSSSLCASSAPSTPAGLNLTCFMLKNE